MADKKGFEGSVELVEVDGVPCARITVPVNLVDPPVSKSTGRTLVLAYNSLSSKVQFPDGKIDDVRFTGSVTTKNPNYVAEAKAEPEKPVLKFGGAAVQIVGFKVKGEAAEAAAAAPAAA